MTHRKIFFTAALLAGLTPVSGLAQTPPAPAGSIVCPPTLSLTYNKVDRLPFKEKNLDIAGFNVRFAPATVRLIFAQVTPVHDGTSEGRVGGTADNAMDVKPGQPLIYTVWGKDEKAPGFPAAVSCEYEGGYMLQMALPATTRTCTLRETQRKAAATETSAREFYTSAVFACR